jgi:hypothetical protein
LTSCSALEMRCGVTGISYHRRSCGLRSKKDHRPSTLSAMMQKVCRPGSRSSVHSTLQVRPPMSHLPFPARCSGGRSTAKPPGWRRRKQPAALRRRPIERPSTGKQFSRHNDAYSRSGLNPLETGEPTRRTRRLPLRRRRRFVSPTSALDQRHDSGSPAD